MMIAAGVILLQLSAAVPGKTIVRVTPVVSTALSAANVPAAASAESSSSATATASNPVLSTAHLTDLTFTNAPDTSPAAKTGQPAASTPAASGEAAPITPITPIHVPSIQPEKHANVESAEQYPRRTWLLLLLAQHGAAAFDAYSTRYAVGHGAVERNPLMRPFVHSDSIYAVSQITPVVMDLVARRMMRSQNGFIRHMWWMPQTLSFGTYTFAGLHNMQVASRQ
jgi:hypothetical protein